MENNKNTKTFSDLVLFIKVGSWETWTLETKLYLLCICSYIQYSIGSFCLFTIKTNTSGLSLLTNEFIQEFSLNFSARQNNCQQ